jgi:uncharacterized protein with von Willebrand factor type A (vWA) domain
MENIIRFSVLLRENGIPTSIRSSSTAWRVNQLITKESPLHQEALATVYVKDQKNRGKFDDIYQQFFSPREYSMLDESEPMKKNSIHNSNNQIEYHVSFQEKKDSDKKAREIESKEINYHPPLKDLIEDERVDLLYQDINHLDSFDPELFQLCMELGKKIATLRNRRLRKSQKMRPDIRKTIRKNLQNGGTLLDLIKSRPRLKNTKFYYLNDVSGSCDWISNWFFCMVYAAQRSFKKIRVFDFDNKSVETTEALEKNNLMEAFTKVRHIRQQNLMIHGTSNMYQAFSNFQEKVKLDHHSTIVILSDCRDWAGPRENKKPQSAEIVKSMAHKCRKLIILNPEPVIKWNVVDSCVKNYQEAGARVHEVRNLSQLSQMIVKL